MVVYGLFFLFAEFVRVSLLSASQRIFRTHFSYGVVVVVCNLCHWNSYDIRVPSQTLEQSSEMVKQSRGVAMTKYDKT